MSNRTLIKSYVAEGGISPARIVKFGAADGKVLQSAAAANAHCGISDPLLAAAVGEVCDVVQAGIADLELGAGVTRGDLLTADANGKGITAAAAAGTNVRIVAVALVSGVAGDIIPVLINLGTFQG